MVVFLLNTVIYVFLLLCLRILIVCLCIFIVPAGTLRLPWLMFFRAFSSVEGQMTGYNSQRRGTARTLSKNFCVVLCIVLCLSVHYLRVNVCCTTAIGWQPNCSLTNTYIISYQIVNFILQCLLRILDSYQRFSVRFAKHLGHAKYSFYTCQIAAMSPQVYFFEITGSTNLHFSTSATLRITWLQSWWKTSLCASPVVNIMAIYSLTQLLIIVLDCIYQLC